MGIEDFRYDGKRALVVGGATGMGAAVAQAVAELGAEVIVMDVAEVTFPAKQAIQVDLRDRASVDAALDQVDGRIDALFSCAGVADGPGLMLINFTSQRHVIDKLLDKGALVRGSAIAVVSSVAGLGWQQALDTLGQFLDTPDWETAERWVAEHDGTDNYLFSKQAMNAYVARQGFPLLQRGIRINAIEPGPTDTPLARANADVWLAFSKGYNAAAGVETLTAEQMANTLMFLCSPAASGLTGISFLVDQGQVNAGLTGAFVPNAG